MSDRVVTSESGIDQQEDAERVRAVRATGLTDGARSPVLDSLCRVVTQSLRVPVSLVTLLDDTVQHVPGGDGLERLGNVSDVMPLSHSICRHALAGEKTLIISSAAEHPLTRGTPPVTELGVGAYAGVALADEAGRMLGALCAIDFSPREWSEADVAVLRNLAVAASAEVMRRPIEQRYQLAVEATTEVIYAIDPDTGNVWRQGALHAVYGRSAAELAREGFEGWVRVLHPDDRDHVVRSWEEAIADPARLWWTAEYRILHPDERVVAVRDRARITRDERGAPRRIAGAVADVTIEKAALSELQLSDMRFRTTLEALREGVLLQDRQDRIQLSNAAAARTLGLTEDQLHGRSSFDPGWYAIREDGTPFDPTEHPSVVALRTNEPQANVLMGVCKPDGSRVWISIDAEPIRLPGESVASSVVVTFRDVTQERETAQQLASLASIVSSSPFPVISIAPGGAIRTWNLAAERFFGRSGAEMIGRSIEETIPADRREQELALIGEAERGRSFGDFESVRRNAEGVEVPVLIALSPVYDDAARVIAIALIVRDISSTRQLEAELRQSQKLEAMGRLAGGVAHDFNNLLTAIRGSAELLRLGAGAKGDAGRDDASTTDDLREILQTVDRAAGLTRQLLAFSRKQVVEPRVLSLNEVVNTTVSMLRRVIGEDVALRFDAAADDPLVLADRGQLEQVLLNLAVNSRDAMPTGGEITIAVSRGTLGRRPAGAPSSPAFDAPYAVLSVADTGSGMDEQTRLHAFEPFFTTKDEGKGTGLGLSTVYGIANQAGGVTWITSAMGAGTTVWVALPTVDEARVAQVEHAEDATRQYRGTVLVVEDDSRVLEIIGRLLARFGFHVLSESSASGGMRRLDLLIAEGRQVDAVVTDMVMPGGGGKTLIEHAQRVRPDLPILVVSGYPGEASLALDPKRRIRFLAKPFSARSLVEALDEIMH